MSQTFTNLSNCDREPIHAPGNIQPHGFLVVVAPGEWTVCGISSNARDFLWREPNALIGAHLSDLLGGDVVEALQRAQDHVDFARRARFLKNVTLDRLGEPQPFALVAHAAGDLVILEAEPAPAAAPFAVEQDLQAVLARLQEADTIEAVQQLAVAEVRRITGFDRCLLYQFEADWNGLVIAEDRNEVLPSYLHHRFPASDIPQQARELYERNWLRLIPTHSYRPVPIIMGRSTRSATSVDLSLSVLRSVSPIHLEYMRNMGTGSAMSISVLRDGRLWGLISCHSREARHVPFGTRATCELLGQFLSLQLAARDRASELAYRVELTGTMARLLGHMARGQESVSDLPSAELLRLARATGAAVIVGDQIKCHGETPAPTQISRLVPWLLGRGHDLLVWDSLAREYQAGDYDRARGSGLLAVVLNREPRRLLLWFRPEWMRVLEWGGNPHKPAEQEDRRLHPRLSFATWRETVRERAEPWEPVVVGVVGEFRRTVVDLFLPGQRGATGTETRGQP